MRHLPLQARPVSSGTTAMENESGPATGIKALVRWATTPPRAIAVYLVCLVVVGGLSFYVGTLKPKKAIGMGPPPTSAPRN
jgi:hypothetical protein